MSEVLGGRYRLGAVLGAGGMGTVHRARDERLGRDVAIKLLRSGARPQEAERLRREAAYLARVAHPNLVAVLDAGTDGDRAWFTMDLVEGHDLRSELDRHGPLPAAGLRHLLAGAAAALIALHDEGLVHRDLKPANLLLADDGTVRVADLGIAHLLQSDHLTTTGQVIGTVAYLSPEQVAGRPIGTPTDIYALGLVALEALTGVVAYPGSVAESAAARLHRSPEVPVWIQGRWRLLLESMTSLDPAARPSAAQVAAVVDRLPDLPTATTPTSAVTEVLPVMATKRLPAVRSRRRRLVPAAVSVLVALVLAGGGLALVGSNAPAAAPANAAVAPATRQHRASPSPSPSTHAVARSTPPAAASTATAPSTAATSPPVAGPATERVGAALQNAARAGLRRLLERWQHRQQHGGAHPPGPGG